MSGLERVGALLDATGRTWTGPAPPPVPADVLGARDGGRWATEDGALEAVVYDFASQAEHEAARERLAAEGMPGDADAPWGSNGGLLYRALYAGPEDGAAQGRWDAMDVLSALAGAE